MTYTLQDDGTLDTVLTCDGCGEELRYNPEPAPDTDPDDWDRVGDAVSMAEELHTCIPTGYGPRDYENDRNW